MAAKTVFVYPLTGGRDFPIPFEYLARKFIQVTLKGGAGQLKLTLNTDYRFTTKTQITTTQAWSPTSDYDTIEIRRYTSATERLVDFNDGSILRAYDLNLSQIQTLHVAEEARDLTTDTIGVNGDGDLDARNRKIVNVARGINNADAMNVGQLREFDTSTGSNADRAVAAANRADQSRDQAGQSAINASTSESIAVASASTATVAAGNALASEQQALVWANESSRHSVDSAASAAASEDSRVNSQLSNASSLQQADRAKTEADRAKGLADYIASQDVGVLGARVDVVEVTASAALPKTGGTMSGNIKMVESGAGWGGHPPTGIVGELNDVQIQIGDWYPMITSSKFIQAGAGYRNTWQIGHFREGGADTNGSFVVAQTGDGPLSTPLRFSIGNTGVHLRGGSGASASLNSNGDVFGDAWRGLLSNWLGDRGIKSMNSLGGGGFTVNGSTPAVEFLIPATVACMWYLEPTGIMHLSQSDGAGGWIGSRIDIDITKSTYLFRGQIEATGNIIANSDRRLKDDIKKTSGLSAIAKLEGVQWVWNKDHNNAGKVGTGLIAQDVQKVLPEAITENADGILGLNYNGVIGLLVNAVNELSAQVKELKAKLK